MSRKCIGCRVEIARPNIACRPCWCSLPLDVRQRVSSRTPSVYIRGAVDAVAWFRENPRGGDVP